MRKLLIGLGLGGAFTLAVFGLFLLKSLNTDLENETSKSKKYSDAEEQIFDEHYMDFYGLDYFDTNLPVIYIDTQGNTVNSEMQVMTKFSILNSEDDGEFHNIKEIPDFTLNAGVNYRGASSSAFDKKQYRVTFYKDSTMKKKRDYDLFGMGSGDSWILNGPFLDKSMARNYLVYSLGSEVMEWAPDCKYVELFVDGRYQGVYLLLEPVSQGIGRLDLSEYALMSGETAYIVSRDRVGTDFDPLNTFGKYAGYTSNDLYVNYPGQKNITESEYKWITKDISEFEMALYGENFKDPKKGYAAYIDVDNFVDYYILNEVVLNHDAGNLSTYAYKEIDGKLKMVLWDYNNCYDNYQWFAEDFDAFYLPEMAWFERLLQDEAFVDKVVNRYYELRENELSVDHMYDILDTAENTMGDAIDRNYMVWGYIFEYNIMSEKRRHIASYEDADAQLRYSIIRRFNFLDEHITDLYGYCVE